MKAIKDISGQSIKMTDLEKAIQQCSDSPYIMESGHTVGENHRFMLKQLEKLKMNDKRTQF